MKLVHITTKKFQSLSADNVYILNLAEQFNNLLKGGYSIVVANKNVDQLKKISVINLRLRKWKIVFLNFWTPYFFYFFWLPFFVFKTKRERAVVFDEDGARQHGRFDLAEDGRRSGGVICSVSH